MCCAVELRTDVVHRALSGTNAGTIPVGLIVSAILGLTVALSPITRTSDTKPDSATADFFESKVRPLLAEHCYKCHSAQTKSLKGGLRLDNPIDMRKGGDTGPAVVPGDVEASLLVKAVRYRDEELRMPPKGKLPAEAIAALEDWVKQGAVTPAVAIPVNAVAKNSAPLDFESARKHWAFQPVLEPKVPRVKHRDWASSAVNSFVLTRLEAAGLEPSAPADRRTLIHRAFLRPDRLAANRSRDRGLRKRPRARCVLPARQLAAGLASIWRALGPALARRGSIC